MTMPNPSETQRDRAQVIQADRDAAAELYRSHYYMLNCGGTKDWAELDADKIIAGEWDDNWLVQAFARHRLAFANPPAAEPTKAATREAFEAETYRDMHEIATQRLGYPSILEALEHLADLNGEPTKADSEQPASGEQ